MVEVAVINTASFWLILENPEHIRVPVVVAAIDWPATFGPHDTYPVFTCVRAVPLAPTAAVPVNVVAPVTPSVPPTVVLPDASTSKFV